MSAAPIEEPRKTDEELLKQYLWSVEDVAQFFGVGVQTVYRWNREDGPPFSKVGKYNRYRRDDCLAWFKNKNKGVQ